MGVIFVIVKIVWKEILLRADALVVTFIYFVVELQFARILFVMRCHPNHAFVLKYENKLNKDTNNIIMKTHICTKKNIMYKTKITKTDKRRHSTYTKKY